MGPAKKVVVIGWDSAPPQLVFGEWLEAMPNLRRLVAEGLWGEIESSVPPITVPAWSCFATSKNPGQLGFFGFRNRQDYSYEEITLATSTAVKEPTVWEILSRAGKRVGLIGVPQTYPPRPVNGFVISCFLTPDTSCPYTYPTELKEEIARLVGNYLLDVEGFRTEDKDRLLREIYEMTEKRFAVAKHLLRREEPDFFMLVEMGPDRIQHGFWKFCDPLHPKHVPGSPYQNVIKDYYLYLDQQLGELLSLVDRETAVMVVSDHGAKAMQGSVNVNDWLLREGYLKLKEPVAGLVRLKEAKVDWAGTRAWGWGGYHGRVFLNVAGREPAGVIPPGAYASVQEELAEKLHGICDPEGRPLGTQVLKPQEVYRGRYVDRSPDLLVYFGNLSWRATEEIGHTGIYSFETEVGPDDAVHDRQGMFVLRPPGGTASQRVSGAKLLDGAPTILRLLGMPVPEDMEGKSLV